MTMGWLCLLLSLCTLTFAQSVWDGHPCEVFAIRREGVVFLRIDTIDTQKVVIPDQFVMTVDTVRSTEFIFNDQYIFSLVKTQNSAEQVLIRKRRVDEATGLWVVPRPVRSRVVEGMWATDKDGNRFNVATLGLWELREYMKDVNRDSLEFQGISDPFADTIKYNTAGQICSGPDDTNPACLSVMDDLFEVISATASAPAVEYFASLRDSDVVFPEAGEEGYDGVVQTITVKESSIWDESYLENAQGYRPGEAGFRFTDDEVEDVFWIEAKKVDKHEILPGLAWTVFGWRGGQVLDFELENGRLVDGHIVVGPFPNTDPNDVVHY